MHKSIVLALGLGFAQPVAADQTTYDFDNFSEINASAGVRVNVVSGSEHSVLAEARRGNLRRLKISQDGDALNISRRTGWGLLSAGRRDRFVVTVTMPSLDSLAARSGAYIDLAGARGGELDLSAKSGAQIRARDVAFDEIDAEVKSGADLSVAGTCSTLEAETGSGGRLDANGLVCVHVIGESSSGSNLNLNGTSTARLDASSGGSIRLDGGATVVEAEQSSGGSIRY